MEQETAANILAGLIFCSIVYYTMYIPYRNKKAGVDTPKLLDRIKRDVLKLFNK